MSAKPKNIDDAPRADWRKSVVRILSKNRHFIIALVVLFITAGGMYGFGWVEKKPVPWPEGIRVNEDFRLLSLPDEFGPFVKVKERIFKEDEIDSLGMGDWIDKSRRERRRSNWYLNRIYEDTRLEGGMSPYRYWLVEIYYYTGRQDLAPHVPERCLREAGNEIIDERNIKCVLTDVPSPWDNENGIHFQGVEFRQVETSGGGKRRIQYYAFSLNGRPEWSWEKVRWELAKPWVDYCYFAKIQFTPQGYIEDMDRSDEHVQELIKVAMPDILKTLRTPSQFHAFRTKGEK